MRLKDGLPLVISLFRGRLTQMEAGPELHELLSHLQSFVSSPTVSPRVAWLCYRVIDEILKRCFLKKLSDDYMPLAFNAITEIKLKPSPNLLNSLPLSYFETNQ